MADAMLTVLLLLATGTAVLLAHRAVRSWRHEEAGRAYELSVDHRGTALRAGAAGAVALVAATLAVSVSLRNGSAPPRSRTVAATSRPTRTAEPVPPPPPRTPEPAPPPPPEVRTIGHPAGGTLQMLQDGTQVWLPPRYDSARAAGVIYPVVVAHVPPAGDPDLYAAFSLQVLRRLSDPFILVLPRDCRHDSATALAETARRYRALTALTAQAVIGIGPEAPCAVQEALANPARYTAAVGVSGTYPRLAPAPGPHPALLLATASGETAPRHSGHVLRDTLRPRGYDVRVLDGIPRRRELFALVASYLTEELDGPARVTRPPAAPVETPHPQPHLTPATPATPTRPIPTAPARPATPHQPTPAPKRPTPAPAPPAPATASRLPPPQAQSHP